MEKLSLLIIFIAALNQYLHAQLSITTLDSVFTVNFDSTLTGVNRDEFSGLGFAANPVSGQIDSDGLIVTGMSDGDLNFGDSGTLDDFAQGSSDGGVSTGGVYAFRVSTQNSALGFQSTESDWTPGGLILKVTNSAGAKLNTLDISYRIYTYNDQDRASALEFYYSTDNSLYHKTSTLNFTSVQSKDVSPVWTSAVQSLKISAEINNGEDLYLKWEGSDATGSGSRDEIALDDITIEAHAEDIMIIITEVADNSISDEEYVEIFNGGTDVIDIEGWKLIERYNPNNNDSREITFIPATQKNSGGSGYFNLTRGEYAVVVRGNPDSFKSAYLVNGNVSIFEDFWPPAMTGDERYMLVNALGDEIDKFGLWDYADDNSFRLDANSCYERINDAAGDGGLESNWLVSANSVYNYTPGSGNITPLPVELISFEAEVKDEYVILRWQTASEINNYGFEVERKIKSQKQADKIENPEWKPIGFVQGHGNSHSSKQYLFTDYPYKPGKYFYRLRQIDINGSFEYSKSVEVFFPAVKKMIKMFQNYPNPFNPVTTINFSLPNVENVTISVYNLPGEKLMDLFRGTVIPGRKYSVKFYGADLPSGVYFYTLETPEIRFSKKMIILK